MPVYPSQTRAIDPYASYNSNVVNKFTRLITNNTDALFHVHAIDVAIDSTSPLTHIVVGTGQAFKDDVLISIDADQRVDLSDADSYPSGTTPWNEAGYYYVALDYTYAKQRPAPQVAIRVLKPSQASQISYAQYLFIKAVKVIFNGSTFEIESIHDWDPLNNDIKRIYTQVWVGVEETLPSFVQETDEGRIIYVRDEDELYYGTSGAWESFGAIRVAADTTLTSIGQIVYLDLDGKMHAAVAGANKTLADAGVLTVGTIVSGDGKVRLYGRLNDVPIEPGRSIQEGENVYLSATTPGAVTDLIPPDFPQYIGVSVSIGSQTSTCNIWFMPGKVIGEGGGSPIEGTQNWFDRYQDMLLSSIYNRLTVDTLTNLRYTDETSTTAVINTYDFKMDGNANDVFQSTNLIEDVYDDTSVVTCMLSGDTTGTIQFYLSNDGGVTWDNATIHQLHYFSTVSLQLSSLPALPEYQIGEIIQGNVSDKEGLVMGWDTTTNKLLLSNVSGTGAWSGGETIYGADSTAARTILSVTEKGDSNKDVRVKGVFETSGAIYDYGILYEEDQNLIDTNLDNKRNINTLYADVYTTPSLDNDGVANLATPLETIKDNLHTFVGKTTDAQLTPPYTSTSIIDSTASLATAISQLDENINLVSGPELSYLRSFMGKDAAGSETPTYTSTNYLSQSNTLEGAIGELDENVKAEVNSLINDSTAELGYLRAFTGKNAPGVETPTYSSTNYVSQSTPLETAIGALDLGVGSAISGLSTGYTLEDGYIRTFIGKNSSGLENPSYSSIDYVTQNVSLETAIGQLDNAIGTISGDSTSELEFLRTFVGKSGTGGEVPTYSSVYIIDQNSNLEIAIGKLDSRFKSTDLVVTMVDGDVTPTVLDGSSKQAGTLLTNNSSPTIITNFDNAVNGWEITVIFSDANTTVASNTNIKLSGGLGFTGDSNDSMTLTYKGSVWIENNRSLNV